MKLSFVSPILMCLGMLLTAAFPLSAQQRIWHPVAANDCGVEGAQPFLVKGDNYTFPASVGGSPTARTCNFGGKVIYAFNQLDIHADYQLEVVYLADHDRDQHIVVDGNELHAVRLKANEEQHHRIDLPRKAYAYGQLVLVFELNGKGANAVVSEVNLYSTNAQKAQPFEGAEKETLSHTVTYHIDTDVDVEAVLPTYAPLPKSVSGTYQPLLSLNGTWLFHPAPDKDFYRQPATAEWKGIVVPGQWSMQGFQVDSMAFAGYRKTFLLPDDWTDKTVKVRFDGVHSEYYVYLNGQEVGYHLGGMTPFEADLTPYLRSGQNELALRVRSESLADMLGSLTQYAAHQLGGITRKVTLMALPRQSVTDLRIATDLDEQYRNATLSVHTGIVNQSGQVQKGLQLRLSIDGLPNHTLLDVPALAAGESWTGQLTTPVTAPRLWNSEQPHLYTLRLELCQGAEVLETIEKRFGFREVEVRGNELLVNGRAVKLRGVCHHEMHPLTGRVMTTELERQDMELYKAANCNFIRTSHYPPCEEMLDICDELGLFVEVEAPVCWIGHGANENWQTLNYQDSRYYGYVRQADLETIHFNRNHPSVLFWSMANESYWNKEFAQVQEYVKKADPTRPHTFHDQAYGGFNNQGSTAPIANIHYPGPNGYKVAAKSQRPMTYGEYCHLNVYNRSELETDPGIRSDWALALSPTWENMYRTKGVLGGSIWSGIDDIFQLPDGNAVGYGAWGPIDGWRRPKPEYWDMKKIYSPIRILTSGSTAEGRFQIRMENRFTYLSTADLSIRYRYGNQQGSVTADIAAGQQGELLLPLCLQDTVRTVYLSFADPQGRLIDEFLLPTGAEEAPTVSAVPAVPTRLKKTDRLFIVTGKGFRCEINRQDGRIVSLSRNGKTILCGGPYLMALPLTGGGCYPNHNAHTPLFNEVCQAWTANSVEAHEEGTSVVLTVKGSYDGWEGEYQLHLSANGELTADYRFTALADINPRQWGLVFEAPVTFDRTFWDRKGMWSVYPAYHISRPQGTAPLFYPGVPQQPQPRIAPTWEWSMDSNELGSNDFRSTRRNIRQAGLCDEAGNRITAVSNGEQHWRSWLEKDRIRFLVADFVTAGNEMFLESYYAPYRKPVKKGETIKGSLRLRYETSSASSTQQ